jgi:hypothetical protein
MQNITDRKVQSYRRVTDWGKTRDGVLQAAPAAVHANFAALGDVITGIETGTVTQAAQHGLSSRVATDAHVRRNDVRDAMRPITKVARTLQGTVFGIGAISQMPNTSWDNGKLVNAANSMVENATTFSAVLVGHGLQPDCIETLKTAAAALKSSITARGTARATAVGARDAVTSGLKEGKKLVSLIDAGLTPLLKDPAMLASWRNAKRITVKGVIGTIVPTAPAATAPSTTPPASAATTTPVTRAA